MYCKPALSNTLLKVFASVNSMTCLVRIIITIKKGVNLIKLTISASCVLFLVACGGGGGGGGGGATTANSASSRLSNMVITDSAALFIAPSGSNYTASRVDTSFKNVKNRTDNANTVFTVSDAGVIGEVSWTDEDGVEMTAIDNPIYLENINNGYMVVAFGPDLTHLDSTYLVRISDGAMYDADASLYIPTSGFANNETIKTNSGDDIYFISQSTTQPSNPTRDLIKINLSDPNSLTRTTINPDTDGVDLFEFDGNGNVIYYAYSSNDISSAKFSRIVKSSGGLQNIGNTGNFWSGLDGTLYSQSDDGKDEFIVKHSLTGSTYSPSEVPYGSAFCNIIPNSANFIIYTSKSILVTEIGTSNICEVYNSTMTPRKFSSNMNKVSSVAESSKYYYLAGNDVTDNPVLRRFDPSDDSYVNVLDTGMYDVYKFDVSSDDAITFNALRMNDATKVIGTISALGVVTLLDTQANAEVSVLERVN
jgi:hypothetical protein